MVLVGGGPGNLDLLTVGGLAAIRRADVIVTDRLAPLAALDHARPDAIVVDVAKIPRGASTPQEQINRVLVEHATAGRTVVRFKGGDSFVLGRGGEEWQACAAAGIPVTVLPGVSSATAAPALAGIPLTHRDLTQGFTVVSGHLPPGDAWLDPGLARPGRRQHHPGDLDGGGHAAGDHRRAAQPRTARRHSRADRGRRRSARPVHRTRHPGRHRPAQPTPRASGRRRSR